MRSIDHVTLRRYQLIEVSPSRFSRPTIAFIFFFLHECVYYHQNEMTSDDQFFLDFVSIHGNSDQTILCCSNDAFFFQLASIPHDVKRYSAEVADTIDRHVDYAATAVKDTLSVYLPSIIKSTTRDGSLLLPPKPRSVPERVYDWVLRNRAWTAALIAFFGTGSVLLLGSKAFDQRKRRARRAGNGARKEIIGRWLSALFTSGFDAKFV